jgi:thiol-disulfide isomerase/thioredoxin
MRSLRPAALVAAALVLGACGGGADPAPAPDDAEQPAAAAGAGAPLSFTAETLEGGEVDAASLEGEPVLLWFWAPWCTICRAEAPEVAAVAQDLQGQVHVLGVAGRGRVEDMRAFVDDTGTAGVEHLVDADGSLWSRFGIVAQPAYAFVAPDGSVEVFAGALGGDELRERAEALAQG